MAEPSQEIPYIYSPLEGQDSFRVLELAQGSGHAPLRCRLLEVDRDESASFEALSYTWGNPIFPERIVEEGQDATLRIAENLSHALLALREADSVRRLWIDALCINQQDDTEKGIQVAQMGKIYAGAQRVIVWLGNEECSKGFDELKRIGQNHELYGFTTVFPFPQSVPNESAFQNLVELMETCDIGAVEDVFTKPWFERVWVVQEFVLARTVSIQSGTSSIDYDSLSKAVCALMLLLKRPSLRNMAGATKIIPMLSSDAFLHAWKLIQTHERYQAISFTQQNNHPSKLSGAGSTIQEASAEKIRPSKLVEYCLDLARNLKCYDERDRLYSMLGFADPALSIVPNYGWTPEQVWTDLALKSLKAGDLSVLHYAGLTYRPDPKLSSFVPDISNPNYHSARLGGFATPVFHAGSKLKPKIELMRGTIMLNAMPEIQVDAIADLPKLKGLVVDKSAHQGYLAPGAAFVPGQVETTTGDVTTITRMLESVTFLANHQRLAEVWSTVRSWVASASRPVYEEGFDKAFARAMAADFALPITQAALGQRYDDDLATLFFSLAISTRIFPQFEDRIFVPDKFIERAFGKPVGFGFAMFEGDEPVFFAFPTNAPSAILAKEFGVFITEGGETVDCTFPTAEFLDEDDERDLQTFVEITEPLKSRLKTYREALAALHTDRCFFTTTRGLIGIGPKHMEEGDLIVVLEGAETAFALKKTGVIMPQGIDDVDKLLPLCTVKGECYLHGWMKGEAADPKYAPLFQEIVLA